MLLKMVDSWIDKVSVDHNVGQYSVSNPYWPNCLLTKNVCFLLLCNRMCRKQHRLRAWSGGKLYSVEDTKKWEPWSSGYGKRLTFRS